MPETVTPETTAYMLLGYAITLLILVALIGYLVTKARNMRAELAMLETLEQENEITKTKPTGDVPVSVNGKNAAVLERRDR
jgi:hypothetical protein